MKAVADSISESLKRHDRPTRTAIQIEVLATALEMEVDDVRKRSQDPRRGFRLREKWRNLLLDRGTVKKTMSAIDGFAQKAGGVVPCWLVAERRQRRTYERLLQLAFDLDRATETVEAAGVGSPSDLRRLAADLLPGECTFTSTADDSSAMLGLLAACRVFAKSVSSECTNIYGWDRRHNRTALLYHEGRRFPNTAFGASWASDKSRQVLIESGYDALTTCEIDDPPRGFCARERIRHVRAARLAAGDLRVAIFVNWRGKRPRHDLGADQVLFRYLQGFISTSSIRPSINSARPRITTTIEVVEKLAEVLSSGEWGEHARLLQQALHLAIPGEKTDIMVHQVDEGRHEVTLEHRNKGTFETLRVPEHLDKEFGLPEEGSSWTCLSVLWKVPILVRNLARLKMMRSRSIQAFRAVHLSVLDTDTKSEMIVPVRDSSEIVAVVDAEHRVPNQFDSEHIRVTEVVGHLWASLREVATDRRNERHAAAATRLLDAASRDGEKGILDALTKEVREIVRADLAYVIVFDHQNKRWRPQSISFRRDVEEAVLESYGVLPPADPSRRSKLVQDTGAAVLVPRPRGLSWTIFQANKPRAIGPDAEHDSILDRRAYARFGMPLACSSNAQPEGILWLAWRNLEAAQRFEEFGPGDTSIHARIASVCTIAASTFALLRLR